VAKRERLLPFGFAYEGTRVRRAVARDQALTLDDVEVDTSSYLWRLREEQVALFG
jgi:predicted homoserine dehydrogenase-like protein